MKQSRVTLSLYANTILSYRGCPWRHWAAGGYQKNNDIAAGEGIFFGKGNCSSCHEVNGRGGVVGPDLSAGTRTPDTLRAKIVNPNAASGGRGGAPQVIVVKRADGREIQGVRRSEILSIFRSLTPPGNFMPSINRRFAIFAANRSLMPQDYATRLTDGELRTSSRISAR